MSEGTCKSCFKCSEVVVVTVRDERGSEWRGSSVRRCANDECWHIVDGTRADRLTWIRNVYDYKYFGDYELSPEQLAAVYEAKILADADDLIKTIDHWRHEVGKLHSRIATNDEQIARLKAAINWCIERDDRNGSLPESYREKLLAAAK